VKQSDFDRRYNRIVNGDDYETIKSTRPQTSKIVTLAYSATIDKMSMMDGMESKDRALSQVTNMILDKLKQHIVITEEDDYRNADTIITGRINVVDV